MVSSSVCEKEVFTRGFKLDADGYQCVLKNELPDDENVIRRFEGFYFADGNVLAEKRKIDFWGLVRASTPHIAPNKMTFRN